MAKDSPINWSTMADEASQNERPHAGYYSWESNRPLAEWGVLWQFHDSLKARGGLFFDSPRQRGENNDPPDCEATLEDGSRVGIEITELVDPTSAELARLGKHYDWKIWENELAPELQRILKKKDRVRSAKGGPYSEYVLVVHTDEPRMAVEDVRATLAETIFARTDLITRAYFLMSYDPIEKWNPCFRLRIEGRPS